MKAVRVCVQLPNEAHREIRPHECPPILAWKYRRRESSSVTEEEGRDRTDIHTFCEYLLSIQGKDKSICSFTRIASSKLSNHIRVSVRHFTLRIHLRNIL